MYWKILIPLDGSELAECVFLHLEAIAGGCQAQKITFVRVLEPLRQPAGDYTLTKSEIEKIEASQRIVAEKYLSEISNRLNLPSTVDIQWQVLVGPVAETLDDFIRDNGIDLVMIATHGRSGVSRWVMGSIADRILRSSCAPVLIVRAPDCVAKT
jgi:nucleotide-binding universal stress UspA family protein